MTTPGGVPNLPVGALTLETLQSKTQDTSVAANRARAAERMPSIFDTSNGGNPMSDLSPFGILTQLFSGFNALVSQADPADINGPEDLPGLLLDFIHELPVVGQFVDLLAAFSGTYDGDDETLLTIQRIVSLFLGADSPLNAANLYGQFGIPITWLNNNAAQALWNPGFDGPDSVVGSKFQWDGTVYRTLSTDHQPGSVRITADGEVHALRSNPYDLNAGDKLDDISARVAWSGLSAAAGSKPMQISLLVMDGTGTQYVDIASVGESSGAAAAGWTGLPAGAQDATLTGDWTATTDCTVVLRLVLDETATAGDIWFDAANMPVIGNGIPTEWLNALVADLAKMQSPFKTIDTFFDPDEWAIAWEGFLDILGLEQTDNQIILNRNSIWTKLFQQVIPPTTLNLHPDMVAVKGELDIIFNPFDHNNLDRAEAWDDLMGLFGLESHTADSVAWWNNLFAANKEALANQSGVTDLSDFTRRSINWLLGQAGWGHLNTAWVWVPDPPDAEDLPTGGFTNLGGAPPAWIADILNAFGISTGDLPSQLDPTIPAAPLLLWPSVQVSGSTSVPQSTNLYYVATVVNTASGKESAPSNEAAVYIAPANPLWPKAQVTVPWLSAPPAGHTISLYRRQSPTGQYRRVASGLTGSSTVDRDPSTSTTAQPGSAAAMTAGVVNAIGDTANTASSTASAAQNNANAVGAQTTQINTNLVGINSSIDDLYSRIDVPTATPSFDSAGTGDGKAILPLSANKEINLSWTHNATSAATKVLVFATFQTGTGNYSWSATYGGVPMAEVGNYWSASSGGTEYTNTVVFELNSPPSGSKTVTFHCTANDSGGANNVQLATANSVAYRDAATTSAVMGTYTNGNSLSQSILSADKRVLVQDFTIYVATAPIATLSGYNQTTRANANCSGNNPVGATYSMRKVVGEALGGPSAINFSASTNAGTERRIFSGVAVELSAR
nr:hypothetical protein [Mycobacterium sp. UM_NZ2]